MNSSSPIPFVLIIFLSFASAPAFGQLLGEVEGAFTTTRYNKIRIPGEGGDFFDAADNSFDQETSFAYRVRGGYTINNRHHIIALFAPLTVRYNGSFEVPILFDEEEFSAGLPTKLDYRFNSYRITYRYDFVSTSTWRFGAGLTAKIRDAYIEVEQNGVSSRRSNVGFVPILNLLAQYRHSKIWGILLEGDALATPFGRAFDLQLAVPIHINENAGVKVGYRVLEGGSDSDEVYNFTWINYFQASLFYQIY